MNQELKQLHKRRDFFNRNLPKLEGADRRNDIKNLGNTCPSCGYPTLDERNAWDICSICFWEDDPIQFEEPDYEGGANRVSLIQARENFAEFGSCERDMIKNCRKPNRNDKRKSIING